MFKQRLAVVVLLLAVVFGLGLVFGVFLPRWIGSGSPSRAYNTAIILKQVQTLSQLVTVKYVMEKVEVLPDPPSGFRSLLPDDAHVVLIAHGVVKAGVDLSRIKPGDLQVSEKKVVLKLPVPQITDAYLEDKQTQVVERNTGFLRAFNKDLEQTARQNAVEDIRRAARTGGILKEADDRARAQLKHLFQQLGLEVEFRAP